MSVQPSSVVGHEALRIVLRLVELVEQSKVAGAYIGLSPELADLHRRARNVRDRLRVNAVRPDVSDLSFCGLCGAYHETPCNDPVAGIGR